jgi:trans-2,3-dihydro-3-hydroxyanthranilate isomerase
MAALFYDIINAFAARSFAGNAIGVVREELDVATMQKVAAELNRGLTVFPKRTGDSSYSVRMFGPQREVPYGGSGSLAAVWAMGEGRWTQTTSGAVVETEFGGAEAWSTQPDPIIRPMDDREVVEAIGLSGADAIYLGESAGNYHVVAVTTDDPAEFRPNRELLTRIAIRYHGATVGAVRRVNEQEVHARVFIPAHGPLEDPACGGGAGSIAAIMHSGFGTNREIMIREGEEMGRPSRLRVRIDSGVLWVGGPVYEAAAGCLYLDV